MKQEDDEIRKRCGKRTPFTVPEGYFDELASKVMEQLPQETPQMHKPVPLWTRMKPWMYLAAMFAGIFFMVRAFVGQKQDGGTPGTPDTQTISVNLSEIPEEDIDPIVDQTMMDDYTLYRYLSDANTEIYK